MKFDKELHQKVRYLGQLYVVILEEFPDYRKADASYRAVLHPISNNWIVRITSPQVRELMTVKKADYKEVPAHVME